jgi:hypothetical protein
MNSKKPRKSPLASMQPSTRWGFLKGARWARRGERRFPARPGAPLLLADHEARLAVEGAVPVREEYA